MAALLQPDWPLPHGVRAFATTRLGGVSRSVYAGFNLADHVGDEPQAVADNRRQLCAGLPGARRIQWLQQVHGAEVIDADMAMPCPTADGSVSRDPGVVCAVLTADCLPLLLCSDDGAVVAAAHAGWRGMLAGVIERTLTAMAVDPSRLRVWIGPAIGPAVYEVGEELRQRFADDAPAQAAFFAPSAERFLADLPGLAQWRLQRAGVTDVRVSGLCTHADARRFYSYRRDGRCGRQLCGIYRLAPQAGNDLRRRSL